MNTRDPFIKIDLGTMPMFDIEYIFLNIRAKSVGEISKLKLLCPDDKKTYVDTEVNLSEVQVQVGDKLVIDSVGIYLEWRAVHTCLPTYHHHALFVSTPGS